MKRHSETRRSLRLHFGTSGRGSARSRRAYATAPLTRLDPASGGLLDGTAEHTKAKVVAPDHRRVPVAARRTAVPGAEVPAAAPDHPVRAQRRAGWICRRTARILAVPILAPLPDVTVHVIQSPAIRFLLANRVCL